MWRALLVVLAGCGAPVAGVPTVESSRALQPLIDAAAPGSTVTLAEGTWAGPVVIEKQLTLDGLGAAVVTGNGKGTVVSIRAPFVTVKGLRITGSGASHDQMDAAVLVEADDARISGNTFDDVLFGVLVKASRRALICGNVIGSKREDHTLRGDGVRLWNGSDNRVLGNDLLDARDLSLANTRDNVVGHNRIRGGRYGLQLIFAPRNLIEDNLLDGNLTGIAVLYSNDMVIRRNVVRHSRGVSGAGLSFKESGQAIVEDNDVVHCAVGARTNAPTSPEAIISFTRNRFAHNIAGMDFYGENGGHVIHDNRFERNLSQVTVSGVMSARNNEWLGNVWDDYQGFDRDGDGVGDTPHDVYAFADRIWQENPQATFFRNAPALELLDFLERLAPFASPELTLSDPKPRVSRPSVAAAVLPDFHPSCPAE